MLFELFHFIFLVGWIGDLGLLYFCIKNFLYINPICLMYPLFYLFVEYFEKMPFFDYVSIAYINSYKKYFKYNKSNNLEELIKSKKDDKNEIIITGPHGVFMTGPIAAGVYGLSRKDANKFKLFVAPILSYNPTVNLICKIIQNGNKVEALNHKNVVKNLKKNTHNLCVSGGGFFEINRYNKNNNVIYAGRWKYWIYNAIKYGYNINFCYVYGGNQDYKSILGNYFIDIRTWLANNYIPFNIVYGKWLIFPFNDFEMQEVFFHLELPHIPNITKEESNLFYDKFLDGVLDQLNKNKPIKKEYEFNIVLN